jgi:hypothetical protein
MKFTVRRVSGYDDSVSPCKGAKRVAVTMIDRRTARTLKAGEKMFWYKDWFERGTNHRQEQGMIACDYPGKAWVIEIPTLEALLKFREKVGHDIAIESPLFACHEVQQEIVIVDWYR